MSLTMEAILQQARPVLPVLVIEDVNGALELAQALHAGGVRVLEVTLRTPRALDAVSRIRQELPDLLVGAGTLIHAEQFLEARDAGAQFAVSPGCTGPAKLPTQAASSAVSAQISKDRNRIAAEQHRMPKGRPSASTLRP